MLGDREFTSEEVARYCAVTRPAVIAWVAQGVIAAHRTAGGHRRVRRAELARFLAAQGYEVPPEVARARPLLFAVGGEAASAESLAALFAPDFEVRAWSASVDLLLALGAERPDVLVTALPLAGLDSARLLGAVARAATLADTLRAAVVARVDEVRGARRAGADIVLPRARLDELRRAVVAHVADRQRRPIA